MKNIIMGFVWIFAIASLMTAAVSRMPDFWLVAPVMVFVPFGFIEAIKVFKTAENESKKECEKNE